MREEQAISNLEIKKKSGLSINPDIHHSKVFSSGCITTYVWIYSNYLKCMNSNCYQYQYQYRCAHFLF